MSQNKSCGTVHFRLFLSRLCCVWFPKKGGSIHFWHIFGVFLCTVAGSRPSLFLWTVQRCGTLNANMDALTKCGAIFKYWDILKNLIVVVSVTGAICNAWCFAEPTPSFFLSFFLQEMLDIMKAIYDMMGKCTYPILKEETPRQHVEVFFQASERSAASTAKRAFKTSL